MMGDLPAAGGRGPSPNRGLIPRVFEHLFARIGLEESGAATGQAAAVSGPREVKFLCKVSFLEIYNEMVTDLLDPSRTNLQVGQGAPGSHRAFAAAGCCI